MCFANVVSRSASLQIRFLTKILNGSSKIVPLFRIEQLGSVEPRGELWIAAACCCVDDDDLIVW